jgi:hypothetical protein
VLADVEVAPDPEPDAPLPASSNVRYRRWLAAGAVAVIVLLVAQVPGAGVLRSLGLLPKADSYTELFLPHASTLPVKAVGGQDFTFQFTVHNVEHRTMTYPWQLETVVDGFTTTVAHGTLDVPTNGQVVVAVNAVMPDIGAFLPAAAAPVLFRVDLLDQGQFVQFFVERDRTNG